MFKWILLFAFFALSMADNMWDEKGFTPAGDKEKVLGKFLHFGFQFFFFDYKFGIIMFFYLL